MTLLRQINPNEITRELRPPVDQSTLAAASEIVQGVRSGGIKYIRSCAQRFREREACDPLVYSKSEMLAALDEIDPDEVALLKRTAERIRVFAQSQRDAISEVDIAIPGGRAGHTIVPVESAGCYAPGGRYPLPSSALMTAVTARVAGCDRVVVASPSSAPILLAAASIAGADEFLAVGGAHAIGAMAYGCEELRACDVIVGPGNKWVTAAKQLVNGIVGIDMLAGPSELLIVADDAADPDLIAADLLAQAEHDTDAIPMLVTTSQSLAYEVEKKLAIRLESLSTRSTALEALANGFVCVVESIDEARTAADAIAAEHLESMTEDPQSFADSVRNAGATFIGSASAEVLADYGAGPNHTLPTGGTAKFQAGLSVMDFLRLRSWMRIENAAEARALSIDARDLSKIEGLSGHAAATEARMIHSQIGNE